MRSTFSILAILVTLCSFQQAAKPKPAPKKPKHPFILVSATSQEWIGGREESGRGINYTITLKTKATSQQLEIDQLWIGDKYHPLTLTKADSGTVAETFNRDEALAITASKFERPQPGNDADSTPIEKTKTVPLPFRYKGQALLGYKLNNKRKYIVVKAFEKLPQLAYP